MESGSVLTMLSAVGFVASSASAQSPLSRNEWNACNQPLVSLGQLETRRCMHGVDVANVHYNKKVLHALSHLF